MKKRRTMSKEEIDMFCKVMEPFSFQNETDKKVDEKISKMKKNCHNCADYIVCWGMEEVGDKVKENCPDWHLDFATYQNLYEEVEKNDA